MTNFHSTDPQPGHQQGEGLGFLQGFSAFTPATPLYQLSWIQEVFRYRNQAYGAYVLRQQYSRNMFRGAMIAIVVVVALCGASLLAENLDKFDEDEFIVPLTMVGPPELEKVIPPPPVATPPPPPSKPTLQFVVPKVIEDDKVVTEYEPPTQDDLLNKNPGTITTEGDPNGVDVLIDEPIPEEVPPVVVDGEENKKVEEPKIFVVVQQMPAFRGNLYQYLAQEIQYPPIAKENGIEGTVVVQFVVSEKGEISNAFVVKDIGGGCGEEALRVVKKMPPWLPGANRGKPVKVQMNLPVKFRLE